MTEPAPDDAIWLPLPGSAPVPLEQHRNDTCRWPVGHRVYCALPVALPVAQSAGSEPPGVYCPTNAAIAYKPRPTA